MDPEKLAEGKLFAVNHRWNVKFGPVNHIAVVIEYNLNSMITPHSPVSFYKELCSCISCKTFRC